MLHNTIYDIFCYRTNALANFRAWLGSFFSSLAFFQVFNITVAGNFLDARSIDIKMGKSSFLRQTHTFKYMCTLHIYLMKCKNCMRIFTKNNSESVNIVPVSSFLYFTFFLSISVSLSRFTPPTLYVFLTAAASAATDGFFRFALLFY